MKNTDPDILVQRFVDGDLSEADVKEALHRIADDAEARDLLQFELQMTQEMAAARSSEPPENFADRVMAGVSAQPASTEAEAALGAWLRTLWGTVATPVAMEVRPVSAVAALFLAAAVAWTVWPVLSGPSLNGSETASAGDTSSSQTVQPASMETNGHGETVWIRFMYTATDADSVAVAGDFSQWDPVPLSPRRVDGETVWTGLVPVSRGEHEYQFLINGERWVTDPLAPVTRSDGFGAKNAVLKL